MAVSAPFDSKDKIFAKDEAFWNNYLKGRPSAPDVFFERIFRYHQAHHGQFDTVHDLGAGNAPYAAKLRSKFNHVIVSDIAPANVALARSRLGDDGFSFRAARAEESDDVPPASVDLVFATNVLHFCDDQAAAMRAVAAQLRPGGTFACAAFGAARFDDARVQGVYTRMMQGGARAWLATHREASKMVGVMARTGGRYNVGPLDGALFEAGAQRIHLNMEEGGITGPLPPEMVVRVEEPVYAGVDDVERFEREEGWGFVTDLEGVREHIASFPFAMEDPVGFAELWREMEDIVKHRPVKGQWPAKIILATRR